MEITASEFAKEVLQSNLPVLVDFYAPWCGPCKMIAPMIEGLGTEFAGRAKVVKVNIDDASDLANQYRITGVPTLMLFKGGEVVETIVGAPSPKSLRQKLEGIVTAN